MLSVGEKLRQSNNTENKVNKNKGPCKNKNSILSDVSCNGGFHLQQQLIISKLSNMLSDTKYHTKMLFDLFMSHLHNSYIIISLNIPV